MFDLNDLAYFVKVVDHGGFAPAARALGMQKSKLSRRIAGLEERLGVRLVQRSTRKFVVTDIGQTYYQHCLAMLVEAETAQDAIDALRSEPAGLIRVACQPGLLAYSMGAAIATFAAAHPKVEIQLKAYYRQVDLIGEGFDLVIRTGEVKIDAASLVTRKLGEVSQCLVASSDLLKELTPPENPIELSGFPGIAVEHVGAPSETATQVWTLLDKEGATVEIPFTPRLASDDLPAVRAAALAGVGVVQMPNLMANDDIAQGRLVELLPEWTSPNIAVNAIFPPRRGMLPSVRALIDHLAGDCVPYKRGT
ncbi:MAG: LysR family transcriptional regulator [Parvularculaceae bacterium]|nr:LysR family transcriptional regulator [Parvularculaceae bacterium]